MTQVDGADFVVQQREHPWLQVGTKVDHPMTTAEAIHLAGLDWTVSKRPLYYDAGDERREAKQRFVIARDTDNAFMGVVGSHYTTFQNIEAFTFADSLVGDGAARIEAAGQQHGGRTVFVVMRLTDGILVAGEDAHDLYLLLRTSHDGSKAVGAYVIAMRLSCTNQNQLAITGARQKWTVNHVGSINDRLDVARETLKLTNRYAESFKVTADRLMAIDLELEEFQDVLEHALPDTPRRPKVVSKILDLYQDSPTNGYTGTGWGALNAVTEYFDWVRPNHTPATQMISTIEGAGKNMRNRVATLLLRRG